MSRNQADIDASPPASLVDRQSITLWFMSLPHNRALAVLDRPNPRSDELPRANNLVDWEYVFSNSASESICQWLLEHKWPVIRAARLNMESAHNLGASNNQQHDG
jgi:hypothetical protein